MGIMDDAKDAAETAGRKMKEGWEDTTDKIDDKIDEMKADANVKKAEAERDATYAKNEANEAMRDE